MKFMMSTWLIVVLILSILTGLQTANGSNESSTVTGPVKLPAYYNERLLNGSKLTGLYTNNHYLPLYYPYYFRPYYQWIPSGWFMGSGGEGGGFGGMGGWHHG